MKKTLILVVMAVMFFASQVMAGAAPDQVYFDSQFSKLQQSITEVQGDTSQTLAILGKVFEGTVPKGGTLTSLCNTNGWNLIVLMGHNNIADPDKVATGASFTYPKTTEEFQAALKRGKPLYDAWLAKQKTTFRVNQIKADTVEIDKLNIRVVYISEQLKIKNMEVDELKIRLAEITEKLRIKELEIEKATIDKLHIKQLEIDNLKKLLAQGQKRLATKTIVLECDDGICWPKHPRGNYFGIGTLGKAKLVGNTGNQKYPADSVSAKIEYHGSRWEPRVVVRNVTVNTEAILTTEMRQEITKHLSKIGSMKVTQSGKNGDSCYEKTWVVDPKTGKTSIFKDESL